MRTLIFLLLACGTILGLAGTDLVLPAIPTLPQTLGGDIASAQFVLAAFTGGMVVGLLVFGSLGNRLGRGFTLAAALLCYGLLSFAGSHASNIKALIVLRGLQGIFALAPAVFAPGIIRELFSEIAATRAIGAMGSLESLAPALAPILGVWLFKRGGWQEAFVVTAVTACLLAVAMTAVQGIVPRGRARSISGSYWKLMANPVFLRYGASQALVLGGLIMFVFGAPTVIVTTMRGTIDNFITMQIVGVAGFIVASNSAGSLAKRAGPELLITIGTALAACSALALLGCGLSGLNNPAVIPYLFLPMNFGLGLRGPPGFYRAIVAGNGDDERAASLTILSVMAVSSLGTALLAPFLHFGLIGLALAALVAQLAALICLALLPSLPEQLG